MPQRVREDEDEGLVFIASPTVYGFRCPPHQAIPPAVAPPPAADWRVGQHSAPRRACLFLPAPNWAPLVPVAIRHSLPHLARSPLACLDWLEPSLDSEEQRFPGAATGTAQARRRWNHLRPWRWASSRSTAPQAPKTRERGPPRRGVARPAAARQAVEEMAVVTEEVTGTTATAPRRHQATKRPRPRSRSSTPWNVYNSWKRKQRKRNSRNEERGEERRERPRRRPLVMAGASMDAPLCVPCSVLNNQSIKKPFVAFYPKN